MDKNATTDETLSEIEQNVIANHTTTIEHITPENHMPGETIILTEAEYKKKEINVKANFITSVVNGKTYYKKALKAETKYKDNVTIVEVTSYYPMNSKLVLKNLSDDQKQNIEISAIRDLKSENYIIYDAYDPHILYSEDDEELDM
jgi:exosome complex RNA-binding protein Csl4